MHTRQAQQGGDYNEVRRRRTPWETFGACTGLFAGKTAPTRTCAGFKGGAVPARSGFVRECHDAGPQSS